MGRDSADDDYAVTTGRASLRAVALCGVTRAETMAMRRRLRARAPPTRKHAPRRKRPPVSDGRRKSEDGNFSNFDPFGAFPFLRRRHRNETSSDEHCKRARENVLRVSKNRTGLVGRIPTKLFGSNVAFFVIISKQFDFKR